LSHSQPKNEPEGSSNNIVEDWLREISKFYEKDGKTDQFKKEESCLRAYLLRLQGECSSSGKLSICKLQGPFKKGGTAIIFRASHEHIKQELAVKFNRPRKEEDCRALVENELEVLPRLEHSNIIRVIDVGKLDVKTERETCPPLSFIVEPLISPPDNLRKYTESLSHFGTEITEQNLYLLDQSLRKLASVLHQWITALEYVHKSGFVYLDAKPDNTIVDKDGHLIMIDFGTAQEIDKDDQSPTEIFFSLPYAHPRITEKYEVTSTNRVRKGIRRCDITPELDFFAIGKSVIELLEIISINHAHDFPQRPLFQSLHFLATRLLDGHNKKLQKKGVIWVAEKVQLDQVFNGLTAEDYATIKYTDLQDVLKDLEKELGNWDPENVVPELEAFPSKTLRVVPNINTSLTPRLVSLIEHPLLARLKMVSQLGLITLVYPTADHSRYDHSLGAYTYTAKYVNALFNDSQNCMFRNLVNENDIKAALLASLFHDLGQYPLAHDLQEVHPKIFDHSRISIDLLEDETKDKQGRTLREIIQDDKFGWGVELERLKRILQAHSGQIRLSEMQSVQDFKADMLSALIDGPIDADKADYIIRDSTGCRLPYGDQLDIERLLSVLTTVRIPAHFHAPHRVTIGIYEKGAASASAFSLARYLLHASVYWHHASRILKTMLQYATVLILPREVFSGDEGKIKELRQKLIHFIKTNLIPTPDQLQQKPRSRFLGHSKKEPITASPSEDAMTDSEKTRTESLVGWYPGMCRTDWQMLNWLSGLAAETSGNKGVALIDLICQRQLYKRSYTMHYDKSVETLNLIGRLESLNWLDRVRLCESVQDLVRDMIRKKEPSIPTILHPPSDKVESVFNENLAILVDIPNYKRFVSDRPLVYVPELQNKTYYQESPTQSSNLNEALDSLMKSISPVRVLCHYQLRQRVGACVSPDDMRYILETAIDKVG